MTDTTTTQVRGERRGLLAYGGLSAASAALLLAYVVVVARGLGTETYGRFAALFGVVVLLGSIFTAVQTYVAGAVASRRPVPVEPVRRWALLLVVGWAVGVPVGVAVLDTSVVSMLLVAALSLVALVWAALLGVVQGRENFAALGSLNTAHAGLRLLAALVTTWTGSVEAVLGATLVAAVVPLAVLGRLARTSTSRDGAPRAVSWPAFLVTLVVAFPTVGDVVVTRAVLDPVSAGAVAGAAVVGRPVVFFAALVAAVAYPRFVRGIDHRRALAWATGVVAAGAGALTLLVLWRPYDALTVLTGDAGPAALGLLPGYVLAMLAFAVASPAVYYVLARRPAGATVVLASTTAATCGLLAVVPVQTALLLGAACLVLCLVVLVRGGVR